MQQSVLILLAEDEELIAFSLQQDLIDAGFTVQHVSTGEQARAEHPRAVAVHYELAEAYLCRASSQDMEGALQPPGK